MYWFGPDLTSDTHMYIMSTTSGHLNKNPRHLLVLFLMCSLHAFFLCGHVLWRWLLCENFPESSSSEVHSEAFYSQRSLRSEFARVVETLTSQALVLKYTTCMASKSSRI
jgi:hypothetical protein